MSYVTDLVFIARSIEDATAFRDAFERYQGARPDNIPSAGRCTNLYVFHLGVNYMEPELREWLTTTTWRDGTTLWLEGEDLTGEGIEAPTIIVWPRSTRYPEVTATRKETTT